MVGSMGALGVEVSSEGGAASGTAECLLKEERPREQPSVLRRRSSFGKVLGLSSWAGNVSASTRVYRLFGMLLMR